jgi:hypothetical protein
MAGLFSAERTERALPRAIQQAEGEKVAEEEYKANVKKGQSIAADSKRDARPSRRQRQVTPQERTSLRGRGKGRSRTKDGSEESELHGQVFFLFTKKGE